jgi:hypothetical protein
VVTYDNAGRMPSPRLLPTSGDARTPWTATGSAVEGVDADEVVPLSELAGSAGVDLRGDAVVFSAGPDVHDVNDDFPVNGTVATIGALDCTFFVNAVSVPAMSGVTRDEAATAAVMGAAVAPATAAVRSTTFVNGSGSAVGADATTAPTWDVTSFAVCVTGAVAASAD